MENITITREEALRLVAYLQNTVPQGVTEEEKDRLYKTSYELGEILCDKLNIYSVEINYVDIMTLEEKEYECDKFGSCRTEEETRLFELESRLDKVRR